MDEARPRTLGDGRWDHLADELRTCRRGAGDPSYAEIARRISADRLARGASPHAARVARTTVYDAFRTGRARVDLGLVREIAHSLGVTDDQVDEWIARRPDTSDPDPSSIPEPAPPGLRRVLLLLAGCVAINLAGRLFVDFLALPVHLDMVGTAIAAIALGPWHGAAVGAASNLLGVASSGPDSLPFGLVNVAGALVWGYGVRRFDLGRTLPRFFALNLLVATVCSLVAVPILLLMYGGSTGHGQDTISATFLGLTHVLPAAVGFSNLLVSLGDKLISGFVALVVVSALPPGLRVGLKLALASPPRHH